MSTALPVTQSLGTYDTAVREFGLMLAALTLARLASVYDPPLGRTR